MSAESPNEMPELDPGCLACQAEYVLAELDDGHAARQALSAFLRQSNERLFAAIELAEKAGDSPTWETIEPLEASSVDLLYALGLFEAILGEADDPAMEAVGTLLRLAKKRVDEMTSSMVPSANAARVATPATAATAEDNTLRDQALAISTLNGLLASLRAAQALDEGGSTCWRVIDHALQAYEPAMEHLRAGNREDAMNEAHEGDSFVQAAAALAASAGYQSYCSADLATALAEVSQRLDQFSNDLDSGGRFYPQDPPLAPKPTGAKKAVAA
ncbi:hypothetical protein SOM08_06040 [Hydrogenophaga sp. SNF1]|uniref:hypothetical protein n=1 Tax=Hydrogenophaga sp. SNF1 TaxID=3098762 RepID=UPI002ACC3363|nr:hypothetical protein [Hydrogenophaga sp. SNF1]WQB84871.1 hypothetical protein SOM08_06040 [Hydrogenophaga sp. SNF1]